MEDKKENHEEKTNAYWKQLSERLLEQEKRKQKQSSTPDHERFDKINRKVIAIHYLLNFLNCPIPSNIQKPFYKICIEIGKNKPLTLKKSEQSQEWEVCSETIVTTSQKATQWEKSILTIVERIKQNSFLMERLKSDPVLLNVALQLDYDSWIFPVAELFENLGIVSSAQELVTTVTEFKKQKQKVIAIQENSKPLDQKNKKKKKRKNKRRKK